MAPTLAPCADDLRGLTRTDPDPRVRRRAHALLLVAEGRTVAAVARLFETGPNRIRAWRARFLAGGRRGLADEPRSGRPPKLNAAALAFLAEALEASPQAYGLPVTVWSIRDLREVLAARLGVRVCTATVHRAVQRLGYRYRRPRHDLRHRQDQEAVAAAEEVLAWRRKKRWRPRRTPPRLLGRVRGPPSPRLAKVWQRRGCPLRVPAAGEDGKFAVFGALDYATGRLVCQTAEHKDGAAFVAFLDHLAAAFPDGPLVVVLDNVGYHKGRRAKDWWMAQQDRVRPLWLPAYAPELNLIERVWRHLKDKLSCHRWWADLPAREVAAAALLSRTEARFHQPDPGGIALVQNFCQAAETPPSGAPDAPGRSS